MATRRSSRKQAPKKRTAGPAVRTSKTRARSGPVLTIQPAAGKRILITDVALRDGHQSLLATRMRTEDMLPIAQKLDAVGYWSLEVWGGATFDTCLRFLKEDPWERLALRAHAQYQAPNAAPRAEPGRISTLRRRCAGTVHRTVRRQWHRRLPHLRRAE